ncbi:iron ABC transporter permease [Candidatus Bipolaricaulota bacterium]|nr:iron ABC transporter permease [Candidatus Bipolaricaulota bacterium]
MEMRENRRSSARGLWRGAPRKLGTPQFLLSAVLLVVLAVFVIVPVGTIAVDTFVWQAGDVRLSREAQPGALTLFHWQRVFRSPLTGHLLTTPLVNSILVGVGTAALSLALGGLLAWFVVRTDMPFRRVAGALAVVPYMIPSYTLALAWLTLFKNQRIGGTAGLFQYLTGVAPPDWVAYGFFPTVIVLALHYYPFVFLLISNALASVDTSLEESAEVLGAPRSLVLRRITLPVILPAVLSGTILTFSRAIGAFGTPYFLGSPVRFFTLPTMIYSNIGMRFPSTANILVLVLIVLSTILIFVSQKMVGVRRSFVTISGKGFRHKPVELGRWKYPALAITGSVILFAAVLPFIMFFWQSVMEYAGTYSFSNFTSAFWLAPAGTRLTEGEPGLLRNPEVLRAAWNSVRLSATAALVAAVLGSLIGYVVVKGRGTVISKAIEQVSFLPYLIPSIAFGAIYLNVFIRPWGPIPALYGTFLLLVLTCAFRNLPFAARSGVSTMIQVSGELEEAAQTLGAGWFYRFRRVVFPLTIRGMIVGFSLVFMTTMRELSLIILLVTPQTRTLTTMTMRYQEQGFVQFANAITVVLVVMSVIGVWAIRKLGGQSGGS